MAKEDKRRSRRHRPVASINTENGKIPIYRKKGESSQDAIERVSAKHGVSPSSAKRLR